MIFLQALRKSSTAPCVNRIVLSTTPLTVRMFISATTLPVSRRQTGAYDDLYSVRAFPKPIHSDIITEVPKGLEGDDVC